MPKEEYSLIQRGVNYDVGTNFSSAALTRKIWRRDLMEQEIKVIQEQLHCNSIQIYGTDIDRLVECATTALERGLHVWLQPRLVNGTLNETLAHLSEVAQEAEKLREKFQNIDLSLGCELSMFASGIMPGDNFTQRASKLSTMWWLLPWFNKKLNNFLRKACAITRSSFKGRISYAAALWENVNWTEFDVVGLNYYKLAYNESNYIKRLSKFKRYNKPIVIFEFGCCSYKGAEKRGPSGHEIIELSWSTISAEITGDFVRDEKVQADYILDLLNIYKSMNIHGAFVYDYIMPNKPFSLDPHHDLDMASYSLVKIYGDDSEKPYSSGYWEPKMAFNEIAKFYSKN